MANKKQRVILKFSDDNFTEQLEKLLITAGKVKVTGLGIFEVRAIKSRSSYNVGSGKMFTLPKHNKLVFKPNKLLKLAIQKYEA